MSKTGKIGDAFHYIMECFKYKKIIDKAEHTEPEYKKLKIEQNSSNCVNYLKINKGVCVRHNGVVC